MQKRHGKRIDKQKCRRDIENILTNRNVEETWKTYQPTEKQKRHGIFFRLGKRIDQQKSRRDMENDKTTSKE